MLFQPVLPAGLTKDVNLITRPVLPVYNIVPHPTASGQLKRTAGFGDMALLELYSPADTGRWMYVDEFPSSKRYEHIVQVGGSVR